MLYDSSYSVSGVALSSLLTLTENVDTTLLSEFAQSNNINILIPVADYYLQQKEFSQYPWFVGKSKCP